MFPLRTARQQGAIQSLLHRELSLRWVHHIGIASMFDPYHVQHRWKRANSRHKRSAISCRVGDLHTNSSMTVDRMIDSIEHAERIGFGSYAVHVFIPLPKEICIIATAVDTRVPTASISCYDRPRYWSLRHPIVKCMGRPVFISHRRRHEYRQCSLEYCS